MKMAQQSAADMYYPYSNTVDRSPQSGRPSYASPAMNGMGPASNRANQQRQAESLGQGTGSFDRFAAFDSTPRYDRMSPANALHNTFTLSNANANAQAWSYSAGASTVNGALHDAGRMRSANRRPNLHPEWMGGSDQHQPQQMHPQLLQQGPLSYGPPMLGVSAPMGLMGNGLTTTDRMSPAYYETGMGYVPQMPREEGLIDTAIVIKNIPFNVRKEALMDIMMENQLPIPYAFNYHFDQGVFRGLAFANFQTAQDTRLVIERMNGLDVHGRKLRVEYKKQLPEHERERIEREKREKRGQLEEQHRPMMQAGGALHTQSSVHSLSQASVGGGRPASNPPLWDLNFNNPETLTYYTELTLFKNDPNREILIFPQNLAPEQRRTIHILAHNLGLEHSSIGEGEGRQVQVLKRRLSPTAAVAPQLLAPNMNDSNRRGLSRAATFDLTSNHIPSGRALLDPLTSPDNVNGLRGVKSFADLRSFTPSPSASQSSYAQVSNGAGAVARFGDYNQTTSLTTPTTPGTGMSLAPTLGGELSMAVGAMGSLSLGGFEASSSPARPRENPGAIGSQRPGAALTAGRGREPDRQPRGPPPAPDWDAPTPFGRGRANGHMQRNSGTLLEPRLPAVLDD